MLRYVELFPFNHAIAFRVLSVHEGLIQTICENADRKDMFINR